MWPERWPDGVDLASTNGRASRASAKPQRLHMAMDVLRGSRTSYIVWYSTLSARANVCCSGMGANIRAPEDTLPLLD
jgi:hypothetical protein